MADEYDAAQERGEIKVAGNPNCSVSEQLPGPADIGLSRKQVHEARQIRDAEVVDPGVVKRTLGKATSEGRGPTKAELQRSVIAAVQDAKRPEGKRRNPHYVDDPQFKRVSRFSALCRQIAEYEDIERIANWNDIPTTAERLPTEVLAARLVLRKFQEAKDNA